VRDLDEQGRAGDDLPHMRGRHKLGRDRRVETFEQLDGEIGGHGHARSVRAQLARPPFPIGHAGWVDIDAAQGTEP
jgi:hypothetical protein